MGELIMMRIACRKLALMAFGMSVLLLAFAGTSLCAEAVKDPSGGNRLQAVVVDTSATEPTVVLTTERAVGYRYTVYDTLNPMRVVIDFPGMDISSVQPEMTLQKAPLESARVTSLTLPSGQLGRVEFLLDRQSTYSVTASGNDLRIVFTAAPEGGSGLSSQAAGGKTSAPAAQMVSAGQAQTIESVDISPGKAVFKGDGPIDTFRFFKLGDPPRLVVDLHDVKPLFKERKFAASGGFRQVRVGTYQDRTRFVFDAASGGLPAYAVDSQGSSVVVSWEAQGQASSAAAKPAAAKSTSASGVEIEGIEFYAEAGQSLITVDFRGRGEVIEASAQGNIVRFGLKNANISRSLRRTLDSSAFPSAVRRVTPYTVLREDKQDVRFAVELKGQVPYTLKQVDNQLIFTVKDGRFAEVAPAAVETVAVPVAMAVPSGGMVPRAVAPSTSVESAVAEEPTIDRVIGDDEASVAYTGEKIRLVFDDADVRDIFQLIAEVSDLNIIVSDEVKGTITLRLIDVPWDQALDLILEIKGLGMLKKGNVVRILPQSKIREMDEAKFTASRNKEKLEDLVTQVISVSYTDLKNVEGPSKELLTERGKITADSRNKQLIVTDVPSVIEQIKKLVTILDTPERQVMIEARIVEADSTFNRNLGVNWGVNFVDTAVDTLAELAGASGGWKAVGNSLGFGGNFVIPPSAAGVGSTSGVANMIRFGKAGSDQVVIDLQLSAMESAGQGKIISRPRVTTLNGESAKISQGTMIPYQTVSDNEITTELVEAALSLEVTPVINPDNSIILTIKASNSSPGTTVATGAGAAPSIDTKEAQTKMLVMDGETTVIGGIFVENEDYAENGVPILRSIPFFGHLFQSSQKNLSRSELLIFITPRILE